MKELELLEEDLKDVIFEEEVPSHTHVVRWMATVVGAKKRQYPR